MKHTKSYRLLYIYEKLLKGSDFVKKETAQYFSVDDKTIQRDIDDLRSYLCEVHPEWGEKVLAYDHSSHTYHLLNQQDYFFSKEEALALAKIILDSRAFNRQEMPIILDKLLAHIEPAERNSLKNAILNESHYYVPPQHGKDLLDLLWRLNDAVQGQRIINITYCRQDGKTTEWLVEPQGLIFNEFYYYLIARIHNSSHDDPAIFRIDRIKAWSQTAGRFSVAYTERFQEGQFRKRIQFMYGGALLKVKFAFWGDSLEAVLDRLPTARVIGREGEKTILEAEVYGNGIKMWFLSQGTCLEVLEPESLRQEMREIVKGLGDVYGK